MANRLGCRVRWPEKEWNKRHFSAPFHNFTVGRQSDNYQFLASLGQFWLFLNLKMEQNYRHYWLYTHSSLNVGWIALIIWTAWLLCKVMNSGANNNLRTDVCKSPKHFMGPREGRWWWARAVARVASYVLLTWQFDNLILGLKFCFQSWRRWHFSLRKEVKWPCCCLLMIMHWTL